MTARDINTPPSLVKREHVSRYLLNRDSRETRRLTLQHDLFIKSLGYHISPSISPTLSTSAVCADIGTGSGIWMLECAQREPSHEYTGFDISSVQFPKVTLPRNVSFEIHDLLTPFPASLHNHFDLVHIRLLLLALPDQAAWDLAAANVKSILKPGGWLQWEEADFSIVHRVLRDSHTSINDAVALRRGLERLTQLTGPRTIDAPEKLRSAVESAGFGSVHEDVAATDRFAETRKLSTWNEIGALEGLQKQFRAQDAGEAQRLYGDVADDERLIEGMYEEAENGNYCILLINCVTARKPE